MSVVGGERASVLGSLYEKCGFQFEENDLSPATRQTITNLAQKLGEISSLRQRVFQVGEEEAREHQSFTRNVLLGGFLILIGLLVIAASPVVAFIIVILGVIGVWRAFHTQRPRYAQMAVAKGRQQSDVDWQQAQLDASIGSLAKSIVGELSELHEQKLHPKQVNLNVNLDFSWLRGEMDKGGLVLSMVKCPQCGSSLELPQTGSLVKCQYCGSTIRATDVFDKLKGLMK
jgi:hypothetical protein